MMYISEVKSEQQEIFHNISDMRYRSEVSKKSFYNEGFYVSNDKYFKYLYDT